MSLNNENKIVQSHNLKVQQLRNGSPHDTIARYRRLLM